MDYREAVSEASSPRWLRLLRISKPVRLGHFVSEDLGWMQVQSKRGDLDGVLPPNFYEVWYALIQEARRAADLAELAAVQSLGERGNTWSQVAQALGPGAGTRQAVYERWKRLCKKYGRASNSTPTTRAPALPSAPEATSARPARPWTTSIQG